MPHSRRSRRKFTREAAWSRLSATAQPDWSSSGEYLVAGKKVAAFTNAEEIAVKLQDTARFMLETPLLEVANLNAKSARGLPALRDVSFTLHRGEVLGVAGVAGNGQSELIEVLAGLHSSTGRVTLEGRKLEGGAAARFKAGVAHIPEDRKYTYWDYQQLRFPRNEGMRIDFAYASPALAARTTGVEIDRNERKGKGASDHVPVILDLAD